MTGHRAGGIIELAYAKVNLALHVLGRQDDGYHELDSIVAFADIADILRIEVAPTNSLVVTGVFAIDVPPDGENLVLKAHALLGAWTALPPVRVHLEKNLPVSAGIGGGSADAAAALRSLAKLVPGKIDPGMMADVALRLGADVPVCLSSRACRMRGIGEHITPLEGVPAPAIVLANPGVACATAAVFSALALNLGQAHGTALEPEKPDTWRNDLTTAALQVQPGIAPVLAALGATEGLQHTGMSGSGATCFGLATDFALAQVAARQLQDQHPQWWVRAARLF